MYGVGVGVGVKNDTKKTIKNKNLFLYYYNII